MGSLAGWKLFSYGLLFDYQIWIRYRVRDIAHLTENGYYPEEIQQVDMFSRTYHVEPVVRLEEYTSLKALYNNVAKELNTA